MRLVVDVSERTWFDLGSKRNRTEVDNAVLEGIPLTKLLDDTEKDILNADMGETYLRIDGKEFHTDVGYALEGVEMFVKILKKRIKKEFHCGVEESGGHAYNCNDCPNKCEKWYYWDKVMKGDTNGVHED